MKKIKHVLIYLSVCLPLVALTASAGSAKTQRGLNSAARDELTAATGLLPRMLLSMICPIWEGILLELSIIETSG